MSINAAQAYENVERACRSYHELAIKDIERFIVEKSSVGKTMLQWTFPGEFEHLAKPLKSHFESLGFRVNIGHHSSIWLEISWRR